MVAYYGVISDDDYDNKVYYSSSSCCIGLRVPAYSLQLRFIIPTTRPSFSIIPPTITTTLLLLGTNTYHPLPSGVVDSSSNTLSSIASAPLVGSTATLSSSSPSSFDDVDVGVCISSTATTSPSTARLILNLNTTYISTIIRIIIIITFL